MKICHIITGLQAAAGTSVFAVELAAEQSADGEEVCILVKNRRTNEYALPAGVPVLRESSVIGRTDIVHVHGLWDPWLTRQTRRFRQAGAKVVWSPHGMLTPWALSQRKLKKRVAWWFYQKMALAQADLLHVTASSEVEDVQRLGLKNALVVAPLGVRLSPSRAHESAPGAKHNVLFISRLQKKKGLLNLMDAWKSLRDIATGWRIVIAGPDQEGHLDEVLTRARQNGVEESVDYAGAVYGDKKEALYAAADIFVLPSFSENFGSVVVEALAQGVPVITTKGTPWQELEARRCGWWVDIGVEPLADSLRQAMGLTDAERREMGMRGRKLVEEKYQWPAIGRQMLAAYEGLLGAEKGLCFSRVELQKRGGHGETVG